MHEPESSVVATPAPGRGRPRSEQAHQAILAATAELLAEGGFAGLRLEHVAARAGVGKATIYRHWGSREALAMELLTEVARADPRVPDLGDTRRELVRCVADQADALVTPPFGPVLRTLLSEIADDQALGESFRSVVLSGWREGIATVLSRGIERGDIRPDADIELAAELLLGPMLLRLVVGGSLDAELAERVVSAYVTGAAPAVANEDWF
jgi:AcrR family transcriptional regulator